MIQPIQQVIFWDYLGKKLKIWKHCHISDSYSSKLLKLMLGYEFCDLMNENGLILKENFFEVRERLGIHNWPQLLEAIKQSTSFGLLADSNGNLGAIFSPLWHEYSSQDGELLPGSFPPKNPPILASNTNKLNTNKKTTVSDSVESVASLSESSPTNQEFDDMTLEQRRKIVLDYFNWVLLQSDYENMSMVSQIKYMIKNRTDRNGKIIATLSDEETEETLHILIADVFVTEFSKQKRFFHKSFMKNMSNRRYWLERHFRKRMYHYLSAADNIKYKRKDGKRVKQSELKLLAEMQNRPISPYEWQDAEGTRFYENPDDHSNLFIPEEAEPRPNETSTYNYIKKQWL